MAQTSKQKPADVVTAEVLEEIVPEIAPDSVLGIQKGEVTPAIRAELLNADLYPRLKEMLLGLKNEAAFEADKSDSEDFVFDLMEKILAAETIDDVFAAQEAGMTSGKDFTNRPFFLKHEDISIRKSSKADGFPFFAMFKVTEVATGEEFMLNCGGKTFMAVLEKLRRFDYFTPTENTPLGAPVVIVGTESDKGAYLSLKPFRMPTQRPASGKK